jgi:hypothetical protein
MIEVSGRIVLESALEKRQMLRGLNEPRERLVFDLQGPLSGQFT